MNRVRISMTFIAFLFVVVPSGLAQEIRSLDFQETRVQSLFDRLAQAGNDKEREMVCNAIQDAMDTLLLQPSSFHHPLDSLRALGKVYSPDGRLRFFTWNLPYRDGTNRFYGVLQYMDDDRDAPAVFRLEDARDRMEDPLQEVLYENEWYGSLVYDIVQAASGDTICYVLLGYSPSNLFISKRVIDILYFQREREEGQLQPVFGKPVFHLDETIQCRIVFAYSARVQMTLQWNDRAEMIVFDHLSPYDPSRTGNYQYYGPDFSYDGLVYEGRYWRLVKDIDIRNIQE